MHVQKTEGQGKAIEYVSVNEHRINVLRIYLT
jgi:hypothetical protein